MSFPTKTYPKLDGFSTSDITIKNCAVIF